jgi:hypothetical protein
MPLAFCVWIARVVLCCPLMRGCIAVYLSELIESVGSRIPYLILVSFPYLLTFCLSVYVESEMMVVDVSSESEKSRSLFFLDFGGC